MEFSKAHVLHEATSDYLKTLDPRNYPAPVIITENILTKTVEKCREVNATRAKGEAKWTLPVTLSPDQIADIIAYLYHVCLLSYAENADSDSCLLAIYQDHGEDEGIYVTSKDAFLTIARKYNYSVKKKEFEEMLFCLRNIVPVKEINQNRDLIAVNNGIFNYATKQLQPFDPNIIFTSKSHVDYNPNAQNVNIHNDDDNTDWDVESWMNSLSNDPEVVNSLWEIIGATIRPVGWDKAIFLMSTEDTKVGNNGKGTYLQLCRNIVSPSSCSSLSLEDFTKEFMLSALISSSANFCDEVEVAKKIDKVANLKAIITNDVIQINRKFKDPISYRYKGICIFCLNDKLTTSDKSAAFVRRQLIVPFTQCFTGKERKYIKKDYLARKEVLEYVLYKVLNMNYYKLSEPLACKRMKDDFIYNSNPVLQFIDEIFPQLSWRFLPSGFVYDLYIAWYKGNYNTSTLSSKKVVLSQVREVLKKVPQWQVDKGKNWSTKIIVDVPELYISKYNLVNWMNPDYIGFRSINKCYAPLPSQSKGFMFVGSDNEFKSINYTDYFSN